MRSKIIISATIVQLTMFSVFAQIQSWPPSGIEASPITTGMHLPANRFVPSSERYNLVWADELFPSTAGINQFIAQNYVASQKMSASQGNVYRAFNSNFIVISYHLSNGINPEHYTDCPLPHGTSDIVSCTPTGWVSEWSSYFLPWLASESIKQNSTLYEQMFQHFLNVDSINRVWHSDPQWTMSLSDTNWCNYLCEVTLNWMSGNQNEGCFFDVAVEEMPGLFNPASGDPSPYNFNWELSPYGPAGDSVYNLTDFSNWMNNQYLGYFQTVYKKFHSSSCDYLIIPNVDQMITGWYDETWMDGDINGESIDGAMTESFGDATGSDMYLTLSRALEHITGRGKILEVQYYDSSQTERYRRTGMYMLIKNENSFINVSMGTATWFPEYEIDLGNQSVLPTDISSLRVAGSDDASLFRRIYQYGMVLCNTADTTMHYRLSGKNWQVIVTSGGGIVSDQGVKAPQILTLVPADSTVSVPASGCLMLKNTTLINTYSLTVINGTGSGNDTTGAVINISANVPPAGQVFNKWTGTINGVTNIYASTTTLIMPSQNDTLTATYKNINPPSDLNDKNITQLELYPNPVDHFIYLTEQGLVSIYDFNGRLQIQYQLNSDKPQIDVSNLTNGIYIIKIINEQGIKVSKFIKQ